MLSKLRKPGLAVAVIGTAMFVVACMPLYTYIFRDHDGRGPDSNMPIPITDKGKPTPSKPVPKAKPDAPVLAGFVTDATTGQPLKEVELSLLDYDDVHGKTPKCRTDSEGRFRFHDLSASTQPSQPVRLVARKEGYEQSDTYTSLGATTLPITLKPLPQPGG
jgi:hypothetical protein